MKIKIGTRGSKLAIIQANIVKEAILNKMQLNNIKNCNIEIIPIKTTGDILYKKSLAKIGGKGLFLKEIEEKLASGEIDIGVHSMKDMPAILNDGFEIATVLKREDPRDVWISRDNTPFNNIENNTRIGTSSSRRSAIIRECMNNNANNNIKGASTKNIIISNMRGNIDTRIMKMQNNEVDGIILAAAGIIRLGMKDVITETLPPDIFIPAVGQGAIAIEQYNANINMDNSIGIQHIDNIQNVSDIGSKVYKKILLNSILQSLNDNETYLCCTAERAFLRTMAADCSTPIGAYARFNSVEHNLKYNMIMDVMLEVHNKTLEFDIKKISHSSFVHNVADAEKLGVEAARILKTKLPND